MGSCSGAGVDFAAGLAGFGGFGGFAACPFSFTQASSRTGNRRKYGDVRLNKT